MELLSHRVEGAGVHGDLHLGDERVVDGGVC